jgi:hypothetical protein
MLSLARHLGARHDPCCASPTLTERQFRVGHGSFPSQLSQTALRRLKHLGMLICGDGVGPRRP